MAVPDRALTLQLYLEGVDAIERLASRIDDLGWKQPACGHWTAEQVVRHVGAVVRWYHEWLDRAEAGDGTPPFPSSELDVRNEREIEAMRHIPAGQVVGEFVSMARSYADRLTASTWDLPYGYPFGTVTAGLHAGAAAAEWHLHAWDLGTAVGAAHRPSDAPNLWRAVGWCRVRRRAAPLGVVLGVLVEAGASGDAWKRLVQASGRRLQSP